MPEVAMSSSRPTNGLTNVAPTFAASSAWAAEKISVTLTRVPSRRQRLARLDAVPGERHLDDDVLVDLRELAPFAQHALDIGRDDFGAGRPLHDLADPLEDGAVVAAFLRQQRRVGGDAVDDAERHQRFDFLEIARVDEESSLLILATGGCIRSPVR